MLQCIRHILRRRCRAGGGVFSNSPDRQSKTKMEIQITGCRSLKQDGGVVFFFWPKINRIKTQSLADIGVNIG